jgi:alpha-beta hydrolase superfamily lysophospholipase
VYVGDLRGHGRSGGARGHLLSWEEAIGDGLAIYGVAGKEQVGAEVVPVGHSVGGSIVLSAIVHGRLRPARFVVSAPALRVAQSVPGWKRRASDIASRFMPALAFPTGLDPAGISRDQDVVAAYRTDPLVHSRMSARFYTEWTAANREVLARAAEIAIPFLATHGREDPIIDVHATEELCVAAGPAATLRIYEGMLHEPYNELGHEKVYEDVLNWLEAAS